MDEDLKTDLEKSAIAKKEKTITAALSKNRGEHKGSLIKGLPFPHEIALENDMTNNEMELLINDSDNKDLRREWVLYKESLKLSFAKNDASNNKDLMNSFNLGLGAKTFPNMHFIFNYKNPLAIQNLNIMLEQTEISKMKMQEKLYSMGAIDSKTKIKEIEDVFDGIK